MDFETMQLKWSELDRKLDLNIRLNRESLRIAKFKPIRGALNWLTAGAALEMAINFVGLVALGRFMFDHRLDAKFLIPALMLDVGLIGLIAAQTRQILAASEVDPSQSIVISQRKLESMQVTRIRMTQAIFLLGALEWAPLLIVFMKGLLGLDAYRILGTGYLAANFLVGLAVIPIGLWIARISEDRLSRYPAFQEIVESLAGSGLMKARRHLSELADFEEG